MRARRDFLRIASVGVAGAFSGAALAAPQNPAIEKNTQPIGAAFNVKDFGAVGDGTTIDSPAINRAIDVAASAGGGTVYFHCRQLSLLLHPLKEQCGTVSRSGRSDHCARSTARRTVWGVRRA